MEERRRTEDRVLQIARGELSADGGATGSDATGGSPPVAHRAAWRVEWLRRWKQLRLPEQLAAFSAELDRARTREEVYTALTEHTARIVGAYICLIFPPGSAAVPLRALHSSRIPPGLEAIEIPRSGTFSTAGLITARDARGTNREFSGLTPLFEEAGAVCVAHAPFGAGGTILLVERRRERVFSAEDWSVLRLLCLQAEAALERVHLSMRGSEVSLDPITGLMAADRLPHVLEHAWAHALGSGRLVVGVIHMYELPDVRAMYGGGVSDQILRQAAVVLRRETSGTGLAVRYGSDECLVLLPQADLPEAVALMRRIEDHLEHWVKLRAGVAQYESTVRSMDELIRNATRAGYGFVGHAAEI